MLHEMEWQVKIEGQSKQRILVTFDPQGELIIFKGQYSIKNNWVDFSTDTYPMDITLEGIQAKIIKVYNQMNDRLKVYDDLNKSFALIKNVEIRNGELAGTIVVTDNSIYGSPVEDRGRDNV
jgi:hypothetical protein